MKFTISSHALPDDLIFSILSRSTVKSIMRFSCVSKPVNALIRSSTFIAAHHRNQIHNANNMSDSYLVHMPNDDSKDQEPCSLTRTTNALIQKYNLIFPYRFYILIGVCEGLICFEKDSNIYIWNPFVGRVKTVPPSGSQNDNVVYRFDFSKRSCDYKVIKQIITIDNSSIVLEIYSLTTDSWRRIEYKRLDCFFLTELQLLFKRFIYWTGSGLPEGLVRFDLDEEIFEEAPERFGNNTRFPSLCRDTWNGVFDNEDLHVLLFSETRVSALRDQYFVPVKESLMLLDKKD